MKKSKKQIKAQIKKLTRELELDVTFEDVKEMIWNEKVLDDLNQIVGIFAEKAPNSERLNAICQIISDAWNSFPHKSLGGLSPIEMSKKTKRK